jgi:penicillin-binding protein 2
MHAMAFLKAGIKPEESVVCGGGLQVGNRFFRCHSTHGTTNMAKAIYQSCDTYFYYFAQKVGFERVAEFAREVGMGQEFDLPVASQFFGTVPDPAWKLRKFGIEWASYDTVNSSIGQGYYLASPLQLAVMSARMASGREVQPRLIKSERAPRFPSLGFSAEYIGYIRQAMSDVVNGPGTAGRARLPLENILLAGKTGTAQVVSLRISDGRSGPWKYRDHGLFIFFAPFDKPRYAGAVVIEHGGGSGAAYPIARDVMTFLFDPNKGLEALYALEKQWGGTAQQRLDAQYAQFAAAAGIDVPPAPQDLTTVTAHVDAEARAAAQPDRPETDAIEPRENPDAPIAPASQAPVATPTAAPAPQSQTGAAPG